MPRAGLDQSRVIDAAAQIADSDGYSALTLARLAIELGVKPPSLYNHVASLDALRDALAARGLHELVNLSQKATAGLSGNDALAALCHTQRRYAQAHPGLYAATHLAVASQSETTLKRGEEYLNLALAVLRGYGLSDNSALHAVRVIRASIRGFIDIESGGGFGLPLDLEVSFQELLQMLDTGLRSMNQAAGHLRNHSRT